MFDPQLKSRNIFHQLFVCLIGASALALSGCGENLPRPNTTVPPVLDQSEKGMDNSIRPFSESSHTAMGGLDRNELDDQIQEPIDEASVEDQTPAPKYNELRLHKNNTILVMSFSPDQRVSYFQRHAGFELDEEQEEHLDRLCRSYDDQYLALERKRARLLANAPNEPDITNKRWAIRQEIFDLNEIVKSRINREVKRPDQVADFEKKRQRKKSNNQ